MTARNFADRRRFRGGGPRNKFGQAVKVKEESNETIQEEYSAPVSTIRKPSQTLRYPNAQITDNTDYLEIKVVEYVPTGNPSNFDFSQPTIPTEDSRAQYGSSNSVSSVLRI